MAIAETNAGLRTPNEARDMIGETPSTDPDADTLKRTGDTSPRSASTSTDQGEGEEVEEDTAPKPEEQKKQKKLGKKSEKTGR